MRLNILAFAVGILCLQMQPELPAGYGWLAARAGAPRSARAVGRVMAGNRFPLLYPCHRVIGADGKLVGFGPGLPMKTYLLEREGVAAPSL